MFTTLDGALDEIARRSFYEDAIVVPVTRADNGTIVGYIVEDDPGHNLTDEWSWTYADGVQDRDSVSETSRLHEAYESYATADHVRYNMTESVDALELGIPVTFGYAIVNDASVTYDDEGNAFDESGAPTDDIAGWILAAIIWEH